MYSRVLTHTIRPGMHPVYNTFYNIESLVINKWDLRHNFFLSDVPVHRGKCGDENCQFKQNLQQENTISSLNSQPLAYPPVLQLKLSNLCEACLAFFITSVLAFFFSHIISQLEPPKWYSEMWQIQPENMHKCVGLPHQSTSILLILVSAINVINPYIYDTRRWGNSNTKHTVFCVIK